MFGLWSNVSEAESPLSLCCTCFAEILGMYVADWVRALVLHASHVHLLFLCLSCSFCQVKHLTANGCQKLPRAFDYPWFSFFFSPFSRLLPVAVSCFYSWSLIFMSSVMPSAYVCCYFCWAPFIEQSVKCNVALCVCLNTIKEFVHCRACFRSQKEHLSLFLEDASNSVKVWNCSHSRAYLMCMNMHLCGGLSWQQG